MGGFLFDVQENLRYNIIKQVRNPKMNTGKRKYPNDLQYKYIPPQFPSSLKIYLESVEKIFFENCFGIGDLFVSRSLVKRIVDEFPDKEFYYIHKYNQHLFKDINLKEIHPGEYQEKYNLKPEFFIEESCISEEIVKPANIGKKNVSYKGGLNKNYMELIISDSNGNLHINTWYAALNNKAHVIYGAASWPILLYNFSHLFELLDMNEDLMADPNNYLSSVDYSCYELEPYKSRIEEICNKYERIILVCNEENATKGIVKHFEFNELLKPFIKKLKNTAFIVTAPFSTKEENVYFTDDILKEAVKPDLIYMGYIAKYCNLIIGRCSGPYTHAMTKEHIIESPKKFLSTTDWPALSQFIPNRDEEYLEHVSPYNENDFIKMLDNNL